MQIVVLLGFVLVLGLGDPEIEPMLRVPWPMLLAGVGVYWLTVAGLTWLNTRLGLARLAREDRPLHQVVHRQMKTGHLVHLWILAGLAALSAGGLCHAIRQIPAVAMIPLADEALAVGVLVTALVLYWRIGYQFDREVRWQTEQQLMLAGQPVRPGWSAGQQLAFNLRTHVLFVALPVGLILLVRDALLISGFGPAHPTAEIAIMVATVATVFVASPLLLRHVWRTRTLPAGELRGRIEELSQRVRLRFRDVLIWDTGGVVVNAAVMGLMRPVRFVMISDAMLEHMTDEQIIGVFGHEAGHVKHHHMLYMLLFANAALLLCTAATAGAGYLLGFGETVSNIVLLVLLLAAWGVGFGWLSRRFERQADVYGAWCAGVDAEGRGIEYEGVDQLQLGTPWFVAALENVARLNGLPRSGFNWRHGSIASRVGFLQGWANTGGDLRRFNRRMDLVKATMWATFAAAAAATALAWPWLSG